MTLGKKPGSGEKGALPLYIMAIWDLGSMIPLKKERDANGASRTLNQDCNLVHNALFEASVFQGPSPAAHLGSDLISCRRLR